MLVRVAPGQVRFVTPGLVADARGVAMGRDLVFRFTTLDRMVTFFRLVTAEQSLDDLAPSIRIVFARPGHGSREVLVFLEQAGAHGIDVAVRAARAAQGQGYTGTARHYVALRDTTSPLGYDISEVMAGPGDVFLYGHDSETTCRLENDLPLLQLILRLELRREHHGPAGLDRRSLPPLVYLVARQGLGAALIGYFHRMRVKAEAALIEGPARPTGQRSTQHLFRLERPPARLARLLQTTPGLDLFVPVTDNLAVAYGHQHPLHLDACRSAFAGDRLILLSPGSGTPRFIEPAPRFQWVQDLVRLDVPAVTPIDPGVPDRGRPMDLAVPLRLVRNSTRALTTVAALVPTAQVAWFKRLCFALPESVLSGYRVAFLDDAVLVVAPETLDWLPFGQLLTAAGRGVLVPVGWGLRPAVSKVLLEETFATTDGSLVLFRAADQPPVRVPADWLQPLQRHVLARQAVPDVLGRTPSETVDTPSEERAKPEIQYKPGGFMPLWGPR